MIQIFSTFISLPIKPLFPFYISKPHVFSLMTAHCSFYSDICVGGRDKNGIDVWYNLGFKVIHQPQIKKRLVAAGWKRMTYQDCIPRPLTSSRIPDKIECWELVLTAGLSFLFLSTPARPPDRSLAFILVLGIGEEEGFIPLIFDRPQSLKEK